MPRAPLGRDVTSDAGDAGIDFGAVIPRAPSAASNSDNHGPMRGHHTATQHGSAGKLHKQLRRQEKRVSTSLLAQKTPTST